MSGVVKIEITESVETLKEMLIKAPTPQAKERIQTIYWLKTQTIETVQQMATMLGRNRVTVQVWLRKYRSGGMEALLKEKKKTGRTRKIPLEIVEKLKEELREPEGFSSYGEIQLWLKTCFDVDVAYRTVHQLVHYQLQGKLKVPRPVSVKQKEEAVEEFKKNSQKN